jgi:toxin-antitoxin system PIN domain toxin
VNIVDANVLLYAVNTSADKHNESRSWLDGALSGASTVGFAWVALLAFLRLSTRVGLFPAPLTVNDASAQVREWTSQPTSVMLEPTPRHMEVLSGLLSGAGTGGNLVNDAHLAALAVEHRATVITYDNDFGRFPGVSWRTPRSA